MAKPCRSATVMDMASHGIAIRILHVLLAAGTLKCAFINVLRPGLVLELSLWQPQSQLASEAFVIAVPTLCFCFIPDACALFCCATELGGHPDDELFLLKWLAPACVSHSKPDPKLGIPLPPLARTIFVEQPRSDVFLCPCLDHVNRCLIIFQGLQEYHLWSMLGQRCPPHTSNCQDGMSGTDRIWMNLSSG